MDRRRTSWALIESAGAGDARAHEEFARLYAPVVRAYFALRWKENALESEVDDGVQEVFVDCLSAGALSRGDPTRPFRPFLLGIARNVALRFEQRRGRNAPVALDDPEVESRETRLSVAFDRAFALLVVREARDLQRRQADSDLKRRRVELLELRFQQGLSTAAIAEAWKEDPARVHHLYADARADFRDCLREVVRRHFGGATADLERECDWMLEVLRGSGA